MCFLVSGSSLHFLLALSPACINQRRRQSYAHQVENNSHTRRAADASSEIKGGSDSVCYCCRVNYEPFAWCTPLMSGAVNTRPRPPPPRLCGGLLIGNAERALLAADLFAISEWVCMSVRANINPSAQPQQHRYLMCFVLSQFRIDRSVLDLFEVIYGSAHLHMTVAPWIRACFGGYCSIFLFFISGRARDASRH